MIIFYSFMIRLPDRICCWLVVFHHIYCQKNVCLTITGKLKEPGERSQRSASEAWLEESVWERVLACSRLW